MMFAGFSDCLSRNFAGGGSLMSKKHGAHGTGAAAPCGVYASVRTCANRQIGGQKADNSHSNEMLGADVGLLSKTENYHGGHTSFMGWSGAWFAGVLKGLGTKTVRISAGTNRSDWVCVSAAFCAAEGHCSAAVVA